MRAIVQYEFGPAENLRYEEVKDPRPGPDQVRVAVVSAGRLVPLIGPPFPLAKAAQAHIALETRATTGKVVLKP